MSKVFRLDNTMTPLEERTDGAGNRVQRFRKQAIKVGDYYKSSTGQQVKITQDMIDNWVNEFDVMKDNGVKVPVPSGHVKQGKDNETIKPDDNRGYVTSLSKAEDGSLMFEVDLIGEDAIAMAGRTDVSIYAEPGYVDSSGHEYLMPIRHIALTNDPVVQGLDGWQAVMLSNEVYTLNQGDTDMSLLDTLSEAFELKDATEENVVEKLKGLMEDSGKVAELESKLQLANASIEELESQVKEPISLDNNVKRVLQKSITKDLDRMVEQGEISADTKQAATEMINTSPVIMLSAADGEDSRAEKIVDLLGKVAKDRTVKVGSKSRGQAVALSNANVVEPRSTEDIAKEVEATDDDFVV